jgi:glycosyltransferase involved in cell wall biosynthesis
MSKKIVLVSSGQPALNPRLVKEADSLSHAGYDVTVLYSYWNDWGTAYDKQLLSTKKWKTIRIGGSPHQKQIIYFFSRLINMISRLAVNKKFFFGWFAVSAVSRGSFFLIKQAKKHKADLYIAHNLGALPAAVKAATAHSKPCGFDAEDFHRNENSDDKNDKYVILKSWVEDKYIPRLNYFTASSPQIADAYKAIFPDLKPIVLLNVFPKSAITSPVHNSNGPLKLFWFSQTIGANRGIEVIISALQLLNKDHFELHLLGSKTHGGESFINKINDKTINIQIHEPVSPDELTGFASQFDIGLSLEQSVPLNRDICLTNKIFIYLQAALAVIVSNTKAQQSLMSKNQQIGSIYQIGDTNALATILQNYYDNRDFLHSCKKNALCLAHEQFNWETESVKFLDTIKLIADNG